jgi:hypothetical protein
MGGADVAILGGRPRRLDAEHDDAILLGGGAGQLAHLGERARIGDDVVGRKRDDQGAVVTLQRVTGAGGDSRPGIAPRRLEQDIGLDADRGELLGDEESVLAVGHRDRSSKQRWIGDPAHGVLEGRQCAEQR